MFRAKQIQGTFSENGFLKENVIVSSYPQSRQTNLSPDTIYPLPPDIATLNTSLSA